MLEKIGIVVIIYVLVLVVRRVLTGLNGTWIYKTYFYLDVSDYGHNYWMKVRCKRLRYILNPFAKTMTLLVPGMSKRKIRIKIYQDYQLKPRSFIIKSIEGWDEELIYTSHKQTYKEIRQSSSSRLHISLKRFLTFKGTGITGILKLYDFKRYTNKELREMLY